MAKRAIVRVGIFGMNVTNDIVKAVCKNIKHDPLRQLPKIGDVICVDSKGTHPSMYDVSWYSQTVCAMEGNKYWVCGYEDPIVINDEEFFLESTPTSKPDSIPGSRIFFAKPRT